MASAENNDAEWIDTNNPIPFRPRTERPSTLAPPRPTIRVRRPRPRVRPHEAPERAPPSEPDSNHVTIISVSVVTSLVVIVLVVVLIYMFVLRKKLQKAQNRRKNSHYSLRVEDVAHLEIDGTENMYMNTTDLQNLVSTLRVKNKELLPISGDYPNLVRVHDEMEFEEENIYDEPYEVSTRNCTVKRPTVPPPSIPSRPEYDDVLTMNDIPSPVVVVTRPAPPPPITQLRVKSLKNQMETSSSREQPTLKPCPPSSAKPSLLKKPDAPPQESKPKIALTPPKRVTNLPLLKMNLTRQVPDTDSGYPTPDTALSILPDSRDQTPEVEPSTMSVTARRAFLEGVIANNYNKGMPH